LFITFPPFYLRILKIHFILISSFSSTVSAVHQTTTTTKSTRSSGGSNGCYCACSWPFAFAVTDLIIGILTTVQSCLLMFVGTVFRNFIVGLGGLCMGLGILSSTTMTCPAVYNACFNRFGFFWTWSGRGIFYIVVGCIVATDPATSAGLLGFITFCLCVVMGFIYIAMECCACVSTGMPRNPQPLCNAGGTATTTTRSANNAGPPAAGGPPAAQVKTANQNPFAGAPKNDLDQVC
jgi:hypothetical protein